MTGRAGALLAVAFLLGGCDQKPSTAGATSEVRPAPPVPFPVALGDPISSAHGHFGAVPETQPDVRLEGMIERGEFASKDFVPDEWRELTIYQMHEVNRGPILQESTTFWFRYQRTRDRIWWISVLFPTQNDNTTLHGIPITGSIDDCLKVLGKPAKQVQRTIILTDYYWLTDEVGYKVSAYHADYSDAVRGTRRKGQVQYVVVVSFEHGPPGFRGVFLDS